jgi:hypothetical protein
MTSLIIDLDKAIGSGAEIKDAALCRTVMSAIGRRICDNATSEDRDSFVTYGGPQILLQLFFIEMRKSGPPQRFSPTKQHIINEALAVLCELCFCVPDLSASLGREEDLILYLFILMKDTHTFETACQLAEEILSVRPSILDLRRIPNFQQLIAGFSPLQLSVFCRVLALLVFEPEDHDQRTADSNAPKVSRSVELLQLRRSRLAGASGASRSTHDTSIHKTHQYTRHISHPPLLTPPYVADSIVNINRKELFNTPSLLSQLLKLLHVQNTYSHSSLDQLRGPLQLLASSPMQLDQLMGTQDQSWQWLPILPAPDRTIATAAAAAAAPSSDASGGTGAATATTSTTSTTSIGGTAGTASVPPSLPSLPSLPSALAAVVAATVTGVTGFAAGVPMRLGMGGVPLTHPDHTAADGHGGAGHASSAGSSVNELRTLVLATHQVEVLFVLCTLLAGHDKVALQTELAQLGLMPILCSMFDRYCTPYSLYTLLTVHSTLLYSTHCTLYTTLLYSLYTLLCTHYTHYTHCTPPSHCTLYSVHCTLYAARCLFSTRCLTG